MAPKGINLSLEARFKPRKTPVQPRGHETRQRILDAAARVFAAHGYSAGTTNRIAEAAAMSVGSLYQYFPNKDAILVELSREHLLTSAASVAALLNDDGTTSLESRIRDSVDAMVQAHVGDQRLHQVLFEQAPRPPDLLEELYTAEAALIEQIAALLEADPDVEVADALLAARIVATAVESLVHRLVAQVHTDIDTDRFTDEVVHMVLGYLSPQRSTT